jgi:predicted RNA-binding Zn ribbon-like protein
LDITCQSGDVTFEFIADNLALDFVGTVSERDTLEAERLQTPVDLARWISAAGVLDDVPPVTARQLLAARQLRESIYRLVVARTSLRALPDADIAVVNRFAARPTPVMSIDQRGRLSHHGSLPAALALIARSGLEILQEADGPLIRWCADPSCTRPFLDHSRGHRRRWCGMSGCGDRAKAAAYRQRQRRQAKDGSGHGARIWQAKDHDIAAQYGRTAAAPEEAE